MKKVDPGKESEDDPTKVGKLDLKATFGKLAANLPIFCFIMSFIIIYTYCCYVGIELVYYLF